MSVITPPRQYQPAPAPVVLEAPVGNLSVSVPVPRRKDAPPQPLHLARAHADAVAALYRLAEQERTAVDWATIQVNVSVGFRRACVIATAERVGKDHR